VDGQLRLLRSRSRSFAGSVVLNVVILGTPLFTKLTSVFLRDSRVNEWSEAESSERLRAVQKALQSRYATPSYIYAGVGEATGAFTLCRLLLPRRPDVTLKRSNVLTWDEIRVSNLIFLGSPKAHIHLRELLAAQDFTLESTRIRNLRPQPGETEEYGNLWAPGYSDLLEDHALIAFLPGLHGAGRILVLAARSTEGMWAAVDYVSEASRAQELIRKLRQPGGGLPSAFQVVLKARFKTIKTTIPVHISYVART